MPRQITPFLMFEKSAEEAMTFYVDVFQGSVTSIERYGKGQMGAEGSVKLAEFTVFGQRIRCIDSPAKHAFGFTPSVSLFVDCESESEFDRIFARLAEKGALLMPPNNYGFSQKFAWLNDRFGVSWQINLP